jgi:glycosyltransferase involved in cell wall biosynthesis
MRCSVGKKKVLLRAPTLSCSGYGTHSRQIARWLLSRDDVDLTIYQVQWGTTPWYVDANEKDGLIGKLFEVSKPEKGEFDVSVQVQLPNEWDTKLAKKNIGITAGVETNVCNPEWLKCISSMDRVIVPSTFTKTTFEKTDELSSAAKNIVVVPESFIDSIAKETVAPLELELQTQFNFLAVGQLTGKNAENDRKNMFNLLKWFCEAFADDDDVGLIVKTNSSRETKIDRLLTEDVLKQVLKSVRKGAFPRVYLLHGLMSDDEMAALYKHPTVKAFITLTRGEGFGLPILEAAASGLPVIATSWSGHMDFLKHGKFIKLDYELKEVPSSRIDKNIFMKGSKWADVNEEDVKKKLLKFRERPSIPTQWAHDMCPAVLNKYSFSAVSAMYDAFWSEMFV